jgi:hypothetical protein
VSTKFRPKSDAIFDQKEQKGDVQSNEVEQQWRKDEAKEYHLERRYTAKKRELLSE